MKCYPAIAAVVVLAGCAAEPPPPSVQSAAAGVAHPAVPVKRPARVKVPATPAPRTDWDIQVARNVTAIMRGMRAVEIERQAETCEDAVAAGAKDIPGCSDE